MDKTYSVSDVASKLNISDKTLRRWEDAGRFRSSRTLGNQRRYSVEDVQILDAIKHGAIPDQADLLTQTQAAALCGVAEVTIDRWVREGKVHPFITMGRTYYPKHMLLSKLGELKQSSQAPLDQSLSQPPEPIQPITTPPIRQVSEPELPPRREPRPSLTPINNPRNQETSKLAAPSPAFNHSNFLLNLGVTLMLILSYHFLFNAAPDKPVSPQGSVQGATTFADPSLTLLKTILDPSGALTTTSISARSGMTTPSIAFNPTSAPANPAPGTIYYDASAQTLKIWKGSAWSDLAPIQSISVKDGTLTSGTASLPKGKNSITVENAGIGTTTPVTVTFTTDYSPAKKYWLEVNQGSFTLHTDFPVSSDAPFNYFILSANLTAEPTPVPSPIVR